MPHASVKTPAQEKAWERAKSRVREQYPDVPEGSDRFYALTMTIYRSMAHLAKSVLLVTPPKKMLLYLTARRAG